MLGLLPCDPHVLPTARLHACIGGRGPLADAFLYNDALVLPGSLLVLIAGCAYWLAFVGGLLGSNSMVSVM
jgi:hypothetical protein